MGGRALTPRLVAEAEGHVKGSHCPGALFPIGEVRLVLVTHIWLNKSGCNHHVTPTVYNSSRKGMGLCVQLISSGQKWCILSNKY